MLAGLVSYATKVSLLPELCYMHVHVHCTLPMLVVSTTKAALQIITVQIVSITVIVLDPLTVIS